MARQQRRPDLRDTLRKVRKGQPHKLPLAVHRGREFDGIIYRWVRDLEIAADAFRRSLDIRNRLSEDAWCVDNDSYVALCKWVETGLDRIQQFDAESRKTLSQVLALPWADLRIDRNDLAHSFQQDVPVEVKSLTDQHLPQLSRLIELFSVCPKPVKSGEPTVLPVYSLEHLRRNLAPLTVAEGAQIGRVGTAYIYVAYSEWYDPSVTLSGYQEDGVQWTATIHNEREAVDLTYIPTNRNRGRVVLA